VRQGKVSKSRDGKGDEENVYCCPPGGALLFFFKVLGATAMKQGSYLASIKALFKPINRGSFTILGIYYINYRITWLRHVYSVTQLLYIAALFMIVVFIRWFLPAHFECLTEA
jgi:hypothetical protein